MSERVLPWAIFLPSRRFERWQHVAIEFRAAPRDPPLVHITFQAGAQTLELDPHSQLAFHFLAWAYEDSAQWDKAIDAWQSASVVHPEAPILREALHAGGTAGYWRTRLAFLSKQKSPDNYLFAVLHARLSEPDQALARLELAYQKHEPALIYVRREPAFDGIERNPRFAALISAMKLP